MDNILKPKYIPDNPLLEKKLDFDKQDHIEKILDVQSFVLQYTGICFDRCNDKNSLSLSKKEGNCVKSCLDDNYVALKSLLSKED